MTDPDLIAAWNEVHSANVMGWQVGQPYVHDQRDCWEQYAFDPKERPKVGKRSREWTAMGWTEVECVQPMAHCLRELADGRWPK